MNQIASLMALHGETPPDIPSDIFDRAQEIVGTQIIDYQFKAPIYHNARRQLLCKKNWDFATRRVTLHCSQYGYFPLPNDLLKLTDCNVERDPITNKRELHTHGGEETCEISYITDTENTWDMPAAFRLLLVLAIAHSLAFMRGDFTLINTLAKCIDTELQKAQ